MTRRSALSTALAVVALVSVVSLTLTACGSDEKSTATTTLRTTMSSTTAAITPTTVAPPTTETTTLPPDTSPVTTPPELIRLPTNAQDYADGLVRAWGKHFDGYVARLAEPDPLAVLAAHDSLAGPTWTRSFCEGAAGSSYCTYTGNGATTLIVRVGNEAASQGQEHAVTEVRFDPA